MGKSEWACEGTVMEVEAGQKLRMCSLVSYGESVRRRMNYLKPNDWYDPTISHNRQTPSTWINTCELGGPPNKGLLPIVNHPYITDTSPTTSHSSLGWPTSKPN